MSDTTNTNFIEYKGKALVREGNNICYGNMSDKAVLFLLVVSFNDFNGHKIPGKILIQILSTDTSLPFHKRLLKQGEKDSLYDAFDIGCDWLERYNAEAGKRD